MLRVASNRDELRTRPTAHPPFIVRAGGQHALMPQDPRGRGTWIAVNARGLVFALLNLHDGPRTAAPGAPSRGLIIPQIFDAESLEEVAWRLDDERFSRFAACRLLALDEERLLGFRLRDGRCQAEEYHLDETPLLFTSSSLGDALVDGPRRTLFAQMVAGDLVERQDAFHAHRWRDRPALSVHMSRPEACTVSTTIVEVTPREVRMVHQPAHCDAGTAVGLILDRQSTEHVASPRPRRQHAPV